MNTRPPLESISLKYVPTGSIIYDEGDILLMLDPIVDGMEVRTRLGIISCNSSTYKPGDIIYVVGSRINKDVYVIDADYWLGDECIFRTWRDDNGTT